METTTANPSTTTNFAGFWMRLVAFIIDAIILGVIYWIAILPVIGLLGPNATTDIQAIDSENQAESVAGLGTIMAVAGIAQLFTLVLSTLYYSFMESSHLQASVGKLAMGLKVTDIYGAKLNFTKALVRNLCKIISSMIMLIGYVMAAFTEKKQALHDIIANTLVLKNKYVEIKGQSIKI